jgi:hypothetical protein
MFQKFSETRGKVKNRFLIKDNGNSLENSKNSETSFALMHLDEYLSFSDKILRFP